MLSNKPPFIDRNERAATRAQYEGLRHERRVNARFEEWFGDWYVAGPWFRYSLRRAERGWHYCQPDGLLFQPDGRLIIVESKVSHTPRAYGQLAALYQPVLEAAFPAWEVCILEVVRWYKSDMLDGNRYPVPVKMVHSPLETEPRKFNLLIMRRNDGTEQDHC